MQFKFWYTSLVSLISINKALAASSSCSFSTTIDSPGDVTSLNSCPTLLGNIEVIGDDIGDVDFSNVKKIDAKLNFFNSSSITNINLNQLSEISGSLSVQALTQLHAIDLTDLTKVEKLSLISLPSLALLNLNKGISSATYIELSDTALSSLSGLTDYSTVGTLNVNNNKNISSIDLSGLKSVEDTLALSFNSDDCEVKLDDLKWASNVTLQDIVDLSLSNLTKVNGTLEIAYNLFESLELKSLEEVGGSVQIFANNDLSELDVGDLKTIGGELRLFNNTELEGLEESFKSLKTVKGAVNIKGPIGNFTLPGLKEIDGTFTFISTSDEFDCDKELKGVKKKVEGHNYTCSAPKKSLTKSNSKLSSTGSSGSTSTGGSSSSSSNSGSGSSSGSSTSAENEGTSNVSSAMIFTAMISSLLALIV